MIREPQQSFDLVPPLDLRAPIVRSTDGKPSRLAAEEMNASGKRGAQARAALALVMQRPGRTSMELAGLGGLDRYQLARRLPDLRDAGLVKNGDDRVCEASGRLAATWWPA